MAASLTAAALPAAAVVAGHLGSSIFLDIAHSTATLRAAIGFIAVTGGALVAAPAFTLILISLARWSRGETSPNRAGPVAMGILWPAWTAGSLLAVPPLFGMGPEIGEILWMAVAAAVAFRTMRAGALDLLFIRRRWASHFVIRASLAFVLLFGAVAIAPAMTVRALLGAGTEIIPSLPDRPDLPLPPEPSW